MAEDVELFLNDRFRVLKVIHEEQRDYGKNNFYASLSQEQVAGILGFSRSKAKKIIDWLIEQGYVCRHNGQRNKYALTEKGRVVALFLIKEIAG